MLICENFLMTPELASKYLKNSNKNARKASKAIVSTYAAAMRTGNFVWNAQNKLIVVEKTNPLSVVDGQHRLMAIVESGVSANLMIIAEDTDGVVVPYDAGRNRALSVLTGETSSTNAFANALIKLKRGLGERGRINFYETACAAQTLRGKVSSTLLTSHAMPVLFRVLAAIAVQQGRITEGVANRITNDYRMAAKTCAAASKEAFRLYALYKNIGGSHVNYLNKGQLTKAYSIISNVEVRGCRKQEAVFQEILSGASQLLS